MACDKDACRAHGHCLTSGNTRQRHPPGLTISGSAAAKYDNGSPCPVFADAADLAEPGINDQNSPTPAWWIVSGLVNVSNHDTSGEFRPGETPGPPACGGIPTRSVRDKPGWRPERLPCIEPQRIGLPEAGTNASTLMVR